LKGKENPNYSSKEIYQQWLVSSPNFQNATIDNAVNQRTAESSLNSCTSAGTANIPGGNLDRVTEQQSAVFAFAVGSLSFFSDN
jgi:hypothetical protein